MQRLLLLTAFVLLLTLGTLLRAQDAREARWWKGNTHTHTLWSDGDAAPEVAADWYSSHGYQFLVLSDHNCISSGERWFPVSEDGTSRLKPAELQRLVDTYGAEHVVVRERDGRRELRLQTLAELRARFERAGSFLFVQGEEITSRWRQEEPHVDFPVHINAANIEAYIAPRGGDSVADLMNKVLADVAAHEAQIGRPVFAHVNHPNFGWGLTWQDLAQMRGERFFEVYNGHRGVRNAGDAQHPGTEEMWDRANALRVTELGLPLLFGIACDDAHSYYGGQTSMPGRGWIMVRAQRLDADALVRAMDAGDFYASSGVTLDAVEVADGAYRVDVAAEEGVTYTTRFIGVREGAATPVVLAETTANPAVYRFEDDELFVRAQVVSDRLHPNPFATGDLETAWAQPVAAPR
jgi:S1-C subfamily serine protease